MASNKQPVNLTPLAYVAFWVCLFGFLAFYIYVKNGGLN